MLCMPLLGQVIKQLCSFFWITQPMSTHRGGYYGNALHAASLEGHKAVVHLLLEHKANVTSQGDGYIGTKLDYFKHAISNDLLVQTV